MRDDGVKKDDFGGLSASNDNGPNARGSLAGHDEYERMLDEKGRVTIPPRIRGALGADFMTARGVDGSVLVIPSDLWPELEERLNQELGEGDRYLQFAIHNRNHTSLDRQGRLKLPKHLLEWASLAPGDAAAIVANGARFEVWNGRLWSRHVEAKNRAQPAPPREAGGSAESDRDL